MLDSYSSLLKEKFKIEELRPKQKEIIETITSGKHCFAVLPTGYGKSLCYQLPSQLLPGLTLVISPLISLMQDQVNSLHKRGIKNATFINSSLNERELYERGQAIKSGEIKILYVAPERFESEHFRSLLADLTVSMIVIDEAHCVSHWGHDFRPQYRRMARHLSQFDQSIFLALTATAKNNVKQEIVDTLGVENCELIEGELDRKNLIYDVVLAKKVVDKDEILLDLVKKKSGPSIIYVNSRKDSERLSGYLNSKGIKSGYYHAGMFADQRSRSQVDFENGKFDAIVCTTAFGMGIDKADVRQVIHFGLPASLENYYQESGRAGRDGETSTCTLIFQKRDLAIQKWLLEKRYPSPEEILEVYEIVKDNSESGLTQSDVLEYTDIPVQLVSRSLEHLRILELVDSIRGKFIALEFEDVDINNLNVTELIERKEMDQERLSRVEEYATRNYCRRAKLIEYFDQDFPGLCEGCDICNRIF